MKVRTSKTFSKLRSLCQLTRLYMSVAIGACAVVGLHLAAGDQSEPIALLLFVAQACIAAAGFALNDILDKKRDFGLEFKPLASGRITPRFATVTVVALVAASLVSAVLVSGPVAATCILQFGTVSAYSWIKQRSGLFANAVTAVLCGSAFALGPVAVEKWGSAWLPAIVTGVLILGRELAKDLFDVETDKAHSLRTVPVIFGRKKTATLILAMYLLASGAALGLGAYIEASSSYMLTMFAVVCILAGCGVAIVRQPARETVGLSLTVSAAAIPIALLAFMLI